MIHQVSEHPIARCVNGVWEHVEVFKGTEQAAKTRAWNLQQMDRCNQYEVKDCRTSFVIGA